MKTQPPIGTIKGVHNGALDGILARLVSRTKFGYTVELLESKGEFYEGDRVNLSITEFEITKRAMNHDSPVVL